MMCKTVANKLFFVVAITPIFLADARLPKRLSTTSSSRRFKSLKSLMASGELRIGMGL